MTATKSSKNITSSKKVVTCYECGASFSLDLSKLHSNVLSFKCLDCGKDVPILARMVKSKATSGSGSVPAHAPSSKQQAPSSLVNSLENQNLNTFGEMYSAEDVDGSEDNMLWLATYGDMMSILLIFFVLMFAISSVDKRKFEIAMTSISQALGGRISFPQLPPTQAPEPAPLPESLEELQKAVEAIKNLPSPLETFRQEVQTEKEAFSALRQQLSRFIDEHQLQDKFILLDENEGLALIAMDMIMFDLGRAEIRPDVLPNLQKIGVILAAIGNNVVVEGHTDDLPILSARFASNWELSVMRATNVVHFFISQCGLDPTRLAAAGYAYYKPRYNNKTPDREKNRRIEVVIKKKYSDNLVDELLRPN